MFECSFNFCAGIAFYGLVPHKAKVCPLKQRSRNNSDCVARRMVWWIHCPTPGSPVKTAVARCPLIAPQAVVEEVLKTCSMSPNISSTEDMLLFLSSRQKNSTQTANDRTFSEAPLLLVFCVLQSLFVFSECQDGYCPRYDGAGFDRYGFPLNVMSSRTNLLMCCSLLFFELSKGATSAVQTCEGVCTLCLRRHRRGSDPLSACLFISFHLRLRACLLAFLCCKVVWLHVFKTRVLCKLLYES